jgi:hypothetical protein
MAHPKDDFRYKEVGLSISEKDMEEIRIKEIRSGSNEDILSIVLQNRAVIDQEQFLIWDINNQREILTFDSSKN